MHRHVTRRSLGAWLATNLAISFRSFQSNRELGKKCLSLSSANYEAAVALLKERFGDPQKIINAHMDALVNLPIVENARDLKESL